MKRKILSAFLTTVLTLQLVLGSSSAALSAGMGSSDQAITGPVVSQEISAAAAEKQYVAVEETEAVTADSFQAGYEPDKVVDGIEDDPNNCWHTPWEGSPPGFPHWIQVEFKTAQLIDSLVYVARSATGFQFITEYEIQVSQSGEEADLQTVAEGTWARDKTAAAAFTPVEARLVRLVAKAKTDSNSSDNYSVSVSELKFGLYEEIAGAMDDDINAALDAADRVLAYAADIGDGVYQFKKAEVDALSGACDGLRKLLGSAVPGPVSAQIAAVRSAISGLLASNKTEQEDMTLALPSDSMTATANTENEGYEAAKAVDGNSGTMWHTQWDPTNTPHPHILTVDLGRSVFLSRVEIAPRQDQKSGKITSGKVYVGDDPEALTQAAAFSAGSGYDATAVDLGCRQGRYIHIESLSSTSANTAVSEVNVFTYDRGYVTLRNAYTSASQLLFNAQTGEEIGQYPEAAVNGFREVLNAFAPVLNEPRTNAAAYDLAAEIEDACAAFANQVNRYSLQQLNAAIEEAAALSERIADARDKKLLNDAILDARAAADTPGATSIQIHDATAALKNVVDALRFAEADAYDLSGKWDFYMGAFTPGDTGFSDSVTLPGTLDENRKGSVNTFRDPRRFSRYYEYTGPASFQRQVFIPSSWQDKVITLYMERSRETRVWVNGEEILSPETSGVMATDQTYDLTSAIHFGELNTVTIVVDNSYPTTPQAAIMNSSMATIETQTNWNGIVGRFELQINPQVYIDDLRIYPNQDLNSAAVQIDVKNTSEEAFTGDVTLKAGGRPERVVNITVPAGETVTTIVSDYDMGSDAALWGEFEQNLYTMTATLPDGSAVEEQFGMRAFGVDPATKQLSNNGNKVFLRNEANCAVFPLTAYAPMDKESWKEFFATYQSYGINAVRFHSWCPPEAAFEAADELGMFLQPELSCWDAGSMFDGPVEKDYYSKEAHAIVKEYANHPSFVMFTFGNELVFASGGYEFADSLLVELKAQDPTRLYSFASNAGYGGTAPTEHSDFFTGQVYRGTTMRGIYAGMGGFINSSRPATTVNYSEAVKRAAEEGGRPAFSFEVGQFQVFPDILSELDGYTGVLDPRNIQLVADRAEEKGISDETVEKYINASGMLSQIGYRMEIEAALRTRHMSGISLLGIQDFPGQSTALVGMMNSLGDPKPYDFADPTAFATFFSPEVALLETEKFCWTSAESFNAKLLLANYGPDDLTGEMFYRLADGDEVIAEGVLPSVIFPQGDVTEAGTLELSLAAVKAPAQLTLTIGLGEVENTYDIWVYPAQERAPEGDVYIAEFLDEEALYVLESGGKVLLSPKVSKTSLPESITGTFTTAFWSSQFVSESQPGSMGLLMDPEHPVFDGFPTEYHSNYQWWPMAKWGRPMILESFTQEDGTKIQPLVQVLDSFSTLRTMGLLYEAKVGEGKLMVSSMGLDQQQTQYPEARALRNSILNYMNSDAFDPAFEVSVEKVQATVVGSAVSTKPNLAENTLGGSILLGENTKTCQIGYDRDPQDRKLELNDGTVDVETSSRSWTDWDASGNYPNDAEITAVLSEEYMVDTVVLPFFEDSGCKAPKSIKVQYWDGKAFADVVGQSQTTGFQKGNNNITFQAVATTQIRLVMEHVSKMGIALSEVIVHEKTVPAAAITVTPTGGVSSIHAGETLQMELSFEPADANDTDVYWRVLDDEGNKSTVSTVTIHGLLKTTAAGKVIVKAELRSDKSVFGTAEITVLPAESDTPSSSSNTTTKTEKNGDGSTTRTVTNKKTGQVTATTTYPDGTKIVATTPKDGETSIEVTVPKDKETVIVTIPTVEQPKPGEVAVIVKEYGTKEVLKTSVATEDGMKVLLSESCKLEIMDNSKRFADVASDHWAAEAVAFVTSRELFTGGDGGFLPAGDMSRAMLFTVLARLDGQKTEGGDTWYSAAMDWAKETGISDGTAPEQSITREQLAAMLYRYAGSPEVKDADMEAFEDAADVSGWAADAMLWCVDSGILKGSDNKLNPQGTATRAEVAIMLQRFIGNMA